MEDRVKRIQSDVQANLKETQLAYLRAIQEHTNAVAMAVAQDRDPALCPAVTKANDAVAEREKAYELAMALAGNVTQITDTIPEVPAADQPLNFSDEAVARLWHAFDVQFARELGFSEQHMQPWEQYGGMLTEAVRRMRAGKPVAYACKRPEQVQFVHQLVRIFTPGLDLQSDMQSVAIDNDGQTTVGPVTHVAGTQPIDAGNPALAGQPRTMDNDPAFQFKAPDTCPNPNATPEGLPEHGTILDPTGSLAVMLLPKLMSAEGDEPKPNELNARPATLADVARILNQRTRVMVQSGGCCPLHGELKAITVMRQFSENEAEGLMFGNPDDLRRAEVSYVKG